MLAGGKAHLVDDTKLYNTAEQIVRLSGHKNAQAFFNDPNERIGRLTEASASASAARSGDGQGAGPIFR